MAATATTWPHGLDPLRNDDPDLARLDRLPAGQLLAWAIERVDQWVAAAGLLSRVRVRTASTWASLILRGCPGRGSSSNPSTPCATKRSRHLLTVWIWIRNCRATPALL